MKKIICIAVILIATVFVANNVMAQKKAAPWDVPAKDKAIKNPVKFSDASTNTVGKEMWAKHCKSCHGSKGLGDGPKASGLKTFPGDFSGKDFQALSDGEILYKTDKGRDEMPGYEKKIPDMQDRWALVNFMRTFKK